MKRRILIFAALLYSVHQCYSTAGDACETVDGNAGQCVDINNCNLQRPLVCSNDNEKSVVYVCCTADNIVKTYSSSKPPILRVRGCGRRTLQVSPRQRATQELTSELRVVGSDQTSDADKYSTLYSWPWMAGLYKKEGTLKLICSASVISANYLLTSAHCLHPRTSKDENFVVRLGSNYANEGINYAVTEVIIHPDYQLKNFYNDIALLRVNTTLDYVPVCLPTPGMYRTAFANRTGTVLGWGLTSYGSALSDILKQVQVPIVPNQECKKLYKDKQVNVTENMICAGEEGKDACAGDGGGPLMLQSRGGKWTIVGLVSFGIGCGESNFPGVYTRIPKYLHWLADNTDIKPKRKN